MITDVVFWLFLAASVAIYWFLPSAMRLAALSLGSIGFIAYLAPESAALLIILAAATWFVLPLIARQDKPALRGLLAVIGGSAGPLIMFKFTSLYGVPWLDGSMLRYLVPLGMSYYVFRLMHVALDAYRFGERPTDAIEFFAYSFLFTIFVAGPIERYEHFTANRAIKFDPLLFRDGLTRIALGLVKQGVLIELVFLVRMRLAGQDFHLLHGAELLAAPAEKVWVLLIVAYLAAYLNLGAYSDVAIGASRLFGLRIGENFNYPIAARNLSDFWRRWHMTLSGWCQTYVFSPVLGATRKPYIALIASFQVMGLWHLISFNRVGWGLFQAGGLIALYAWRQHLRKRGATFDKTRWWAVVAWAGTQIFVTLSFVFVHEEAGNDVLTTIRILLHVLTMGAL